MTVKSERGKSILSKATDYYTLKEKLENTSQAPIEEISYLLTSYNALARDLANQGITLENKSQKYLAMLTKGLEKRISELLPKTSQENVARLKTALGGLTNPQMSALEKLKRKDMYSHKTYGALIMQGIIEQMDNPEDLEVTENYSPKIQHPKIHPNHANFNHILSLAAITEKNDIVSEIAMYIWDNDEKTLMAALYLPEDLHFIAAAEEVFKIAHINYARYIMPK